MRAPPSRRTAGDKIEPGLIGARRPWKDAGHESKAVIADPQGAHEREVLPNRRNGRSDVERVPVETLPEPRKAVQMDSPCRRKRRALYLRADVATPRQIASGGWGADALTGGTRPRRNPLPRSSRLQPLASTRIFLRGRWMHIRLRSAQRRIARCLVATRIDATGCIRAGLESVEAVTEHPSARGSPACRSPINW